MIITKKLIHPELRKHYHTGKILSYIISKKFAIPPINFLLKFLQFKKINGFLNETIYIPSKSSDRKIRTRIFRPTQQNQNLPCVLYLHGGGYMLGNPEQFLSSIQCFLESRPCVMLAPAYRLSLTEPYPAAFNDGYDTLLWAKENADLLQIDPKQFIIIGHSAGGGLAAAITQKARDTKDVNIAFQMPIYPMLDDRQITESSMNMQVPGWNSNCNSLAWKIYLRDIHDQNLETPAYAAPGRNTDFEDFPPTITFVGEYEPFRDETISYVEHLKSAGIPVKFKFYPQVFHAFDITAAHSSIGQDAISFTKNSFCEYYDRYCK